MRAIIKPATIFLALWLPAGAAFAQSKDESTGTNDKTIVIRPDKNSKEKYTIVIDGDKVTVNGKPVDEFDSRDLTITRQDPGARYFRFPSSPMMRWGWNTFTPERMIPANRALLGVVTEETDSGARIKEVSKESAAEKAGLKEGDIITRVNDTEIETPESLQKTIGKFRPEDKVTITYSREGKEYQTSAVLSKNPAIAGFPGINFDRRHFDFRNFTPRLRDFDRENNKWPKLGMQIQDRRDEKGVKVTDITEASAAFKAGLKKEDIITAINGKSVNSVADVKKELAALQESDEIKVTYIRNGKSQTATIKNPVKLETADL